MKAALQKEFPDLEVELVKSKGGAFEVRRDDALVFSKKKTGRFPTHGEIITALKR